MSKFCKTHIVERTEEELLLRLANLKGRDHLGPGLTKEKTRIERALARRTGRMPKSSV